MINTTGIDTEYLINNNPFSEFDINRDDIQVTAFCLSGRDVVAIGKTDFIARRGDGITVHMSEEGQVIFASGSMEQAVKSRLNF